MNDIAAHIHMIDLIYENLSCKKIKKTLNNDDISPEEKAKIVTNLLHNGIKRTFNNFNADGILNQKELNLIEAGVKYIHEFSEYKMDSWLEKPIAVHSDLLKLHTTIKNISHAISNLASVQRQAERGGHQSYTILLPLYAKILNGDFSISMDDVSCLFKDKQINTLFWQSIVHRGKTNDIVNIGRISNNTNDKLSNKNNGFFITIKLAKNTNQYRVYTYSPQNKPLYLKIDNIIKKNNPLTHQQRIIRDHTAQYHMSGSLFHKIHGLDICYDTGEQKIFTSSPDAPFKSISLKRFDNKTGIGKPHQHPPLYFYIQTKALGTETPVACKITKDVLVDQSVFGGLLGHDFQKTQSYSSEFILHNSTIHKDPDNTLIFTGKDQFYVPLLKEQAAFDPRKKETLCPAIYLGILSGTTNK